MSNVAIKWLEGGSRLFACQDSRGHVVIAGSPSDENGTDVQANDPQHGAKASDLLLIGLAACAAHDVVTILERQRQNLTGLRVDVQSRQEPRPPFTFTAIHMHFVLSGNGLDSVKVRRALDLSVNKYCAVAATVRGVAELTHDYEIESRP